jgi:hypothetical protein
MEMKMLFHPMLPDCKKITDFLEGGGNRLSVAVQVLCDFLDPDAVC